MKQHQPNGFIHIRPLSNKAVLIKDLILHHNLDTVGFCEKWLKPNVFSSSIEASLPEDSIAPVAQATEQGRAVALICTSVLFSL